jgi:hypothetical protein
MHVMKSIFSIEVSLLNALFVEKIGKLTRVNNEFANMGEGGYFTY